MSSVRYALEKLDYFVNILDESIEETATKASSIDYDTVAQRLDNAIFTVQKLLQEG